jgi:hypothetical protein
MDDKEVLPVVCSAEVDAPVGNGKEAALIACVPSAESKSLTAT